MTDDASEPSAAIDTARLGQRLVVNGWFASHADCGTPGPHLYLRAADGGPVVLRTDQVPALVDALGTVAERIEAQWSRDGEEFLVEIADRPDPQDPDVEAARRRADMEFDHVLQARLPAVVEAILTADDVDAALVALAPLLGVDESEVLWRLGRRINLLAFTRAGGERRQALLEDAAGA